MLVSPSRPVLMSFQHNPSWSDLLIQKCSVRPALSQSIRTASCHPLAQFSHPTDEKLSSQRERLCQGYQTFLCTCSKLSHPVAYCIHFAQAEPASCWYTQTRLPSLWGHSVTSCFLSWVISDALAREVHANIPCACACTTQEGRPSLSNGECKPMGGQFHFSSSRSYGIAHKLLTTMAN